jgi:hypothetical protein
MANIATFAQQVDAWLYENHDIGVLIRAQRRARRWNHRAPRSNAVALTLHPQKAPLQLASARIWPVVDMGGHRLARSAPALDSVGQALLDASYAA